MRRPNSRGDPGRWIARRETVVRRHIHQICLVYHSVAATCAVVSLVAHSHVLCEKTSCAGSVSVCVSLIPRMPWVSVSATSDTERRLGHHRKSIERNAASATNALAIRAGVNSPECCRDRSKTSVCTLLQHRVQFVRLGGRLRAPGVIDPGLRGGLLVAHGTK